MEIIPDNLRAMLSTSQIRSNPLHHIRLIFRTLPTHRIGLDVLVEKLVRIQLWTVTRQVEQPNLLLVSVYPTFDLFGTMNRMTVHNQKYLPQTLFDQPTKKLDHHRSSEWFLEYHKSQSPPVGNCRYHIAAKTLACTGNDRCLPFETITASSLVIGSHPHFVSPVYLGTFCQGFSMDSWIVFLKPEFHRFRILFVRTAKRFLRCEAPSLQIATGSPHRNTDPKSFFDQLSHCISGPQGKWKFQLVGTTVADQPYNGGCLMTGQARLALGATLVSLQRCITSFLVCREPIVNRSSPYAEEAAGIRLSHTLLENRVNHPAAQSLLRLRRKLSAILCFHNGSYDYTNNMSINYALISKCVSWRLRQRRPDSPPAYQRNERPRA